MGHKLGQVFLKDKNMIHKLVYCAEIQPDDIVVEIGCGDGLFSEVLASKCKKLYIIEIDVEMLHRTQARLWACSNITYIHCDVLDGAFSEIPESQVRVIANIPYYITTKIIKLLIENRDKITSSVLMVQKEYAKRLLAKPTSTWYGSLTLYVQYHLSVQWLSHVPKTCFRPIPEVDSSLIRLSPTPPPFTVDEDLFFKMVKSAFWGRRKTLINCLLKSPYLTLSPDCKQVPFFENRTALRGETLSLAEFYTLYVQLQPFWISS